MEALRDISVCGSQ